MLYRRPARHQPAVVFALGWRLSRGICTRNDRAEKSTNDSLRVQKARGQAGKLMQCCPAQAFVERSRSMKPAIWLHVSVLHGESLKRLAPIRSTRTGNTYNQHKRAPIGTAHRPSTRHNWTGSQGLAAVFHGEGRASPATPRKCLLLCGSAHMCLSKRCHPTAAVPSMCMLCACGTSETAV